MTEMDDKTISLDSHRRIQSACDEFKRAWHSGDRPDLLSYVKAESPARERLFVALLQVELAERRSRGETPTPDEYRHRFSDLANLVDSAFGESEQGLSSSEDKKIRLLTELQLLQVHAEGGLGRVSIAQDQTLQRNVAFKEIKSDAANISEYRDRFVREAEITARLEHPGIVPIYGRGQFEDGRPCYAMRFIGGRTLSEEIAEFHNESTTAEDDRARTLELRRLLDRFIDVCRALEYAHSRRVIHRDLKPQNIMVGEFGETLVVDWGLAKQLDQSEESVAPDSPRSNNAEQDTDVDQPDGTPTWEPAAGLTLQGARFGTPQYMSPEQAAGDNAKVGPASDVYSLGATLYSILTGRPPIEKGTTREETYAKVQRGEFLPPRRQNRFIARPLEAICLKAMAIDPDGRYASAIELAGDIENWLADETVSAYRESFVEQSGRLARRHRTLVNATVLTLAVTTAVSVVASLMINSARLNEQAAATAAREAKGRAELALLSEQKALAKAKAANESFQNAINTYVNVVMDDESLAAPEYQPLRKRLLASAIDVYGDEVEDGLETSEESAADQINTLLRIAEVSRTTGDHQKRLTLPSNLWISLATFENSP